MTTNYLHTLSTKQLISILRHVQVGHDHLRKKLPKQEYKDLLAIGSLSNNQLARMQSDSQERIGNVSIVVNTILTSCFGAWLGFNAFNQSSIISYFGLLIILIALSFGFLTGYLSYILTHKQARLALKMQQLCNVQQVIMDIVIHKRKQKIEQLQERVEGLLSDLNPQASHVQLSSPHKILEHLPQVERPLGDKQIKHLFEKSVGKVKYNVKKLTYDKLGELSEETTNYGSTDFLINTGLTNASYIRILTKSDVSMRHQIPKVNKWLRGNSVGVAVGLLPTFLGSFASMFVFLNGFPAFFAGVGIQFGFSGDQVLSLKHGALVLAFSISTYFAYSHIHSNYKAFKRSKQLEIAENHLSEKSHQMLDLVTKAASWSKIYFYLRLMLDLHTIKPVNKSHLSLASSAES